MFADNKFRKGRGGDHRGIVGRERPAGEKRFEIAASGFLFEAAAQLAVGGDASGNEHGANGELLGGGKSAAEKVFDDRVLKTRDQIERGGSGERAQRVGAARTRGQSAFARGDFRLQFRMLAKMVEDGGFDSAEAEIVRIAAHFGFAEADGAGIPVRSEIVDDGAAGIAEGEHFGDFVVRFTGGVVARAADARVGEQRGVLGSVRGASGRNFDQIEQRMAAGHDETHGRKLRRASGGMGFEKNGVDVTFEVIHGDERLVERKRKDFSVCQADEKRADKAGALGDADGVDFRQRKTGLSNCFANHRNNLAQVLAGSEFRNDAAVFAMNGDLRSDNAGKNF